jgi:signal transduction histidine kinase
MPITFATVIALTLILSTTLLIVFSIAIAYFLFLYQKKQFRHEKEVLELREAFNQTLLQSKLEIQEQTLDHIAKELHANVSHLVSLININLAELLPQTPDMREEVLETKSLVRQLMSELKALSASLNTDHIMHIGLIRALENELNRLAKIKKYQINLNKTGEEFRLSPEHEIILFRLSQEVLNNIISYAKASVITIVITYSATSMTLQISDDGTGFDVGKALEQNDEKASTGLLNMSKRAKLIKADFHISSTEGKGTTITLVIPRYK